MTFAIAPAASADYVVCDGYYAVYDCDDGPVFVESDFVVCQGYYAIASCASGPYYLVGTALIVECNNTPGPQRGDDIDSGPSDCILI